MDNYWWWVDGCQLVGFDQDGRGLDDDVRGRRYVESPAGDWYLAEPSRYESVRDVGPLQEYPDGACAAWS